MVNNPVTRSANDVKNWLFNKKDWNNYIDPSSVARNSIKRYELNKQKNIVLKQIVENLHYMVELRQAYLMNNLVEHFHRSVYLHKDVLNLHTGLEAQEIALKDMITTMKDTIVKETEYSRLIPYRYAPLDVIYDDKYKQIFEDMPDEQNFILHMDFKALIIDAFNTIHKDTNLKHNTLKLIVRFFSEKKEFIRNIERMMLVFHDSEWDFYMWTKQEINKFERKIDKSLLWLKEEDEFYDYKYIKDVLG